MIEFNPLPYQGYIDANNHFLNSFLGGVLIRLFGSDAIWIVRLPNVFAFPLFFWSIYGIQKFFKSKLSGISLLIILTFSSFLVEYFGMARGYGLSMALMLFGVYNLQLFLKDSKWYFMLISFFSWFLAVSANLTLIPLFLFIIFFSLLFLILRRNFKLLIIPVIFIYPLWYFIKYSMFLKEKGKLYYGGQDGFFENSIHSVSKYLWGIEHLAFDFILIALFLFLLFTAVWRSGNSLKIFDPKLVFPILLLVSVCNILLQNWLLGNNFPEDRALLYLPIFFLTSLVFALDYWNRKWVLFTWSGLTTILFLFQLNFSHFLFFKYEHFSSELITEMGSFENGDPVTTGGRFWRMDDEWGRREDIQTYVFQEAGNESDTLYDYIVIQEELRPDISELYESVYTDNYSNLELWKRKKFLIRNVVKDTTIEVNSVNEFIGLLEMSYNYPISLRFKGEIKNTSIHNELTLFLGSKDVNGNQEQLFPFGINTSHYISKEGILEFDFAMVLPKLTENSKAFAYFHNPKILEVLGSTKITISKLEQ